MFKFADILPVAAKQQCTSFVKVMTDRTSALKRFRPGSLPQASPAACEIISLRDQPNYFVLNRQHPFTEVRSYFLTLKSVRFNTRHPPHAGNEKPD
jgi:hypothetical protein